MRLNSVSEDLCGLPHGAMQKKLRAPREIVLLARIQADGLLVFLNGGERIAQFLVEFSGHAIEIGVFPGLQQIAYVFARLPELASLLVSECKVAFVAVVCRIEAVGGLKERQCVMFSAGLKIERAELMVGAETSRRAGECRPQLALGLARFRQFASSPRGGWRGTLRLERRSLTREIFAGSQDGGGSMAADC